MSIDQIISDVINKYLNRSICQYYYDENPYFLDFLEMYLAKPCRWCRSSRHYSICCPKSFCKNCKSHGHEDMICRDEILDETQYQRTVFN